MSFNAQYYIDMMNTLGIAPIPTQNPYTQQYTWPFENNKKEECIKTVLRLVKDNMLDINEAFVMINTLKEQNWYSGPSSQSIPYHYGTTTAGPITYSTTTANSAGLASIKINTANVSI